MGYDAYDPVPDVVMGQGGFSTQVDVERMSEALCWPVAVRNSPAASKVSASERPVVWLFIMNSTPGDRAPVGLTANVIADYRKVVGVPGGL